MKRISLYFLSLLMLVFVLAACSGGGSEDASQQGGTDTASNEGEVKEEPKKKVKWVHGVTKQKGDAAFQHVMALNKGYFDELGIDFQIQEFEGDSTIIKALIAGQVDSMEANPNNTLVALSQGSDLKFVAASIPGMSHVLYTKDNINSVEDLEGKAAAISAPGAFPHILMQSLLFQHDMDIDSVEWVNAGSDAERVQALIAGKVDGAISAVDYKTIVDGEEGVHYIADIKDILPNFLRYVIVVSDKTIDEKGEALTNMLQAAAMGQRYAIENRDEAIELTAETINLDPSDPSLSLVYDIHVDDKLLAPNLELDVEALEWMYELNKELGKIDGEYNVRDHVDLSFAEKAIENIGKYDW